MNDSDQPNNSEWKNIRNNTQPDTSDPSKHVEPSDRSDVSEASDPSGVSQASDSSGVTQGSDHFEASGGVVAFPMFDLVELAGHTDRLWACIRAELLKHNVVAPEIRTAPVGSLMKHWRDSQVLLTQTCGYPYHVGLRDQVGLIGTFAYNVCDDDAPGFYRSVLVTQVTNQHRALESFEQTRVSINNADSLSGCVSLGVALHRAGVRSVASVWESGAHVNSLAALQSETVDLACIDWLTWSLLADVRPAALDGLVIIGRGPQIPCPPLITADPTSVPLLQEALARAIDYLRTNNSETLTALRIDGLVRFEPMVYAATEALGDIAASLLPVSVE